MTRLWVRAVVAFVVMDLLLMTYAGAAVAAGFRGGQEFGGPVGTAVFVAVISAPYCIAALIAAILPAAAWLRQSGWQPTRVTAICAGIALSFPAFAFVVVGSWALDGFEYSLADYVANVLRFQRNIVPLIGAFAIGGATVLSGLAARGMWPGPEPQAVTLEPFSEGSGPRRDRTCDPLIESHGA